MSILSLVQDAAPKVGIRRPSQLVADTGDTSRAVQATLVEVAAQIRDRYDWQVLKTLATITGDGSALAFSLPSDYARMLKKASLWPSTSVYTPLTHYTDTDAWLQTVVQDFTPVIGGWIILSDGINIRMGGQTSPLALADTVSYYYITRNMFSSGGTPQETISADTDTFRLNERLLRLGFIAKWKSDNGRPYAQDASDFEDALAIAMGNDKGSKSPLRYGRRRPANADYALPWPVQ